MVINEAIYQRGEYWTYLDSKKGIFVICKDNSEKCYADVVGFSSDWETAKKAVDEGDLK